MAERSARVRIEMAEPIGSMPSRLGTIRKAADLTRTATALAMQSVVAQTVTRARSASAKRLLRYGIPGCRSVAVTILGSS